MILENVWIALLISKVVFRDMLSLILFSITFENVFPLVWPGVRVEWVLVVIEAWFKVRITGGWSEERSRKLIMFYFMWFGSVVTKKSRTSWCLGSWWLDCLCIIFSRNVNISCLQLILYFSKEMSSFNYIWICVKYLDIGFMKFNFWNSVLFD
jgi:hypothetical protein